MLSSVLAGVGAAQIMVNASAVVLGLDETRPGIPTAGGHRVHSFTTWLVSLGAEESSRATLILTVIQYGGLALFAAILFGRVLQGNVGETVEAFSWSWFNPFAIGPQPHCWAASHGHLHLLGLRRLPWRCPRKPRGPPSRPGRSGVIAISITVITYVISRWPHCHSPGSTQKTLQSTHEGNIDDVSTTLATESLTAGGAVVAALIVGMSVSLGDDVDRVAHFARIARDGHLQGAAEPIRPVSAAHPDAQVRHLGGGPVHPGDLLRTVPGQRQCRRGLVYSVGIAIMTYYTVVALSSVVYFWRTAFRSVRTALAR